MTTETETYRFTAAIKGIGKPPSGKGWMMTFDWKLPPGTSQFDFIMYGQNMEDIKGWALGDVPDVVITRGALKTDRSGNIKSGSYEDDYFWNLGSMTRGNGEPTPLPTRTASAPSSGGSQPRDSGDLETRIAWNSAVNNAVHLMGAWESVISDAGELIGDIKYYADIIYDIILGGPSGSSTSAEAPESDAQPFDESEAPTYQGEKPEHYCELHGALLMVTVGAEDAGYRHPVMRDGKVAEWCTGSLPF